MKSVCKLFILAFLMIVSSKIIAQDTIIKKDNSRISAKVIEVHDDEIHYKKFNNLEGPTYVIETSKISSIVYQNGEIETYDVQPKKTASNNSSQGWEKQSEQLHSEKIEIYSGKFYYNNRRIGVRKLKRLIFEQGDPEAIRMWNSYKIVQGVGYGLGFAAIPIGGIALIGLASFNPDVQLIIGGGGFVLTNALLIANHVMRAMYKNKRMRSVELYNEALKEKSHEEDDYY